MKRPGIKEIARQSGYSVSTVSLALRGATRISASTREKIWEVAKKINYRPNYLARGLVGGRTHTVGVVMSRMRDTHHLNIFAGIEETLSERGYAPLLTLARRDPAEDVNTIDNLIDRAVDGLILNPLLTGPGARERVRDLVKQGFPIVAHVSTSDVEMDRVMDVDPTGAKKAVAHLLDLGHRRVALVYRPTGTWRLDGYRQALEERGLPFDRQLVFEYRYETQTVQSLRQQLMSLKDRPTGVFVQNDHLAAELIRELQAAGFETPRDVSVVGVNDTWYASMLRVPLTTLRLRGVELGRTCAGLLMERLNDPSLPPRVKRLDLELVVRDSTAPPPA